MTTDMAKRDQASLLEQVLVSGDLAKLSPQDRLAYYQRVTESLGLNPFTRPFEYIVLNGKLTLYAKRDATDQLRKLQGVSITKLERDRMDDVYVVTAYARDGQGRTDSAIGAVSIANLKGDALANAMMKAETKAKRRVTLSLCGLGWLDETEIETVPQAQTALVDAQTGEILSGATEQAPPRGRKRPSQAMLDRWAELWHQARQLGLEVEPLPADVDAATLAEMGSILKRRIAAAQMETTEPATVGEE